MHSYVFYFPKVHVPSQLKDLVLEEFDGILPKLGVVNWENVVNSANFVECWRCFLWAKAFIPFFQGERPSTKSTIMLNNPTWELAMRHVIYRCASCPYIVLNYIPIYIYIFYCMILFCSIDTSQGGRVLATLYHCKPFHHS